MADRRGDLVVFDVDGTLMDSTYLHALAWSRAFAAANHVVPTWLTHRRIGMGGDKLVGDLLGDEVEKTEGDELRAAWQAQYEPLRRESRPLDGAAALVRRFHEQEWMVALASSGEPQYVEDAIEALGIRDAVDVVISSADVDASKPDADIIGAALERGGPERAVTVGDSPYDISAAAKLGLGCVAVRSGGFGVDELTEAGAATVVSSLRDALDLDWDDLLEPTPSS